jgi:hypothetical protein
MHTIMKSDLLVPMIVDAFPGEQTLQHTGRKRLNHIGIAGLCVNFQLGPSVLQSRVLEACSCRIYRYGGNVRNLTPGFESMTRFWCPVRSCTVIAVIFWPEVVNVQ